jgi:methyl-accepting chemotaxis protein
MSDEVLDEAALVAALDATRTALEKSGASLEAASSAAARGQSELESISDPARGLPSRGRDVRASLQVLHQALERAKLSALNAGLEGARIGDPLGKAVVDLAGDLRELVSRGIESLEAHATVLAELELERERWVERLGRAREALAELGEQVATSVRHRHDAQAALAALQRGLAPVLGTDPATARALLLISEQSSRLAAALMDLSNRRDAATRARLREALAPVLAAVAEDRESDVP